ncbi:MAG: hypothetical protein N2747_06255 [Chitinophagaceae bacterium]|nr:hypothetical protein [Chitinophagaceae bacterium]
MISENSEADLFYAERETKGRMMSEPEGEGLRRPEGGRYAMAVRPA